MAQLPIDVAARKGLPMATGLLDYFPDALAAVAAVSMKGNDQHNPGTALHWDRSKSGDEADALMRHLVDRGTFDTDGLRHSAKVAWRALALLQREIEGQRAEPGSLDALRIERSGDNLSPTRHEGHAEPCGIVRRY